MIYVFQGGKYDGLETTLDGLLKLDLFKGEYTEDESEYRRTHGGQSTQPPQIDNIPRIETYLYPYWEEPNVIYVYDGTDPT